MRYFADKIVYDKYEPENTNVVWVQPTEEGAQIKAYIDGEWQLIGYDHDAYRKPASGIPESDLEESVRNAIDNAQHLDGKIDAEIERSEGVDANLNERLGIVEQLADISISGGDATIATASDFNNPTAEQKAYIPTVGAILDGADTTPTSGSGKLVTSGGVYNVINSLKSAGYVFAGVATTSTSPGTPTEKVFYLGGAGTYANFGTSITVEVGSMCIFKYNGSWTKERLEINGGYRNRIVAVASRADISYTFSTITFRAGWFYVFSLYGQRQAKLFEETTYTLDNTNNTLVVDWNGGNGLQFIVQPYSSLTSEQSILAIYDNITGIQPSALLGTFFIKQDVDESRENEPQIMQNYWSLLLTRGKVEYVQGSINNDGGNTDNATRCRIVTPFSPSEIKAVAVPNGYVINEVFYYTSWTSPTSFTLDSKASGGGKSYFIFDQTKTLVRFTVKKPDNSSFLINDFLYNALSTNTEINDIINIRTQSDEQETRIVENHWTLMLTKGKVEYVQGTINNQGGDGSSTTRCRIVTPFSPSEIKSVTLPDGYVINEVYYYTSWTSPASFVLDSRVGSIGTRYYAFDQTKNLVRFSVRKPDSSSFDVEDFLNATLSIRSELNEIATISSLADSMRDMFVQDYFKDEMSATIDTVLEHTDTPAVVLPILTDSHWASTERSKEQTLETLANVRGLCKGCYCDGVVHLGDVIMSNWNTELINDGMTQVEADVFTKNLMSEYLNSFSCTHPAYHAYMVGGNHDGASLQTFRAALWYSIIGRKENADTTIVKNGVAPYFYVDYNKCNLRCIFLQQPNDYNNGGSSSFGYTADMLSWLANDAMDVDNGVNIIMFSHIPPFHANYMTDGIVPNRSSFYGLCNAFNNHTTFSDPVVSCDFSSLSTSKMLCYICGHTHGDAIYAAGESFTGTAIIGGVTQEWTFTNGLPCTCVIITNTYVGNSGDGITRNGDCGTYHVHREDKTVEQEAWDTMLYNPSEKKIYFIRFGSGQDRIVDVSGLI